MPSDPSPDNIPEVSFPTTPSPINNPDVSINTTIPSPINSLDISVGYNLPFRHNRGKPPNRYSPDSEERRLKYPIANYVSTQKLEKPLKEFVYNLSACQVPNEVQESLEDSKGLKR